MFTVRIIFPGVDAKFDARFADPNVAIRVQDLLGESLSADCVCLLPPRDGGKTRFVRSIARQSPNFSLTAQGRGFVIRCARPDECDFYGADLIYLTNDREKSAIWDHTSQGWIVNRRDIEVAEQFIRVANAGRQNRTKYT